MKSKSDDLGDPSLIGLSCESGDFSDCNLNVSSETVPFGCEGVLIFSEDNKTCGTLCNSKRKKRSATEREGWTKFFINADSPNGTGDHEHYFHYYGSEKLDRLKVYDTNGNEYEECVKKAIHVRERQTMDPWWKLTRTYTLLFSEFSDEMNPDFGSLERSSKYFYRLKPNSG